MTTDYFEVFGLPRRLAIDTDALRRRFYELARRHHPDFHQAAAPEERDRAERESAVVNAAYRALRDPIARAEYLVRLEDGRMTRGGGKPKAPAALLQEMFEIQEALADAKAGGLDDAVRATLAAHRDALRERYAAEEARLCEPLSRAWDAAAEADAAARATALAALTESLTTRAYLRTVIDDLETALGEREGDVAHHRH